MPEKPTVTSPPLEDVLKEIHASGDVAHPPLSARQEARESAPRTQYMRFGLRGVHFAVPLLNALEVGRLPRITPLPNLPEWVEGISNIRGEVVSMVDLTGFFGWEMPDTPGDHMVLLHSHGMKVGFRVEGLMGIVSLPPSVFASPSNPVAEGEAVPFLKGVAARAEANLYLLDVDGLLSSEKINRL